MKIASSRKYLARVDVASAVSLIGVGLIKKWDGVLVAASLVATALLISACTPAATAGADGSAAGLWEVDFSLSGGIAGMAKQMTISHDGRLVVEDLRRRSRTEKQLSVEQRRELHRRIEQAESAPGTGNRSLSRCADCLQYRLTVRRPEGKPTVSESGAIEQQQSKSPELIKFLTVILNETIQP